MFDFYTGLSYMIFDWDLLCSLSSMRYVIKLHMGVSCDHTYIIALFLDFNPLSMQFNLAEILN